MKWMYPDGGGLSCWYCEKNFSGRFKHKNSRERVLTDISKDSDRHADFQGGRQKVIKRFGEMGKGGHIWKQDAGIRASVKRKKGYREVLDKPPDDFWLLEDYDVEFGDPR
jgi:hypothetical protein